MGVGDAGMRVFGEFLADLLECLDGWLLLASFFAGVGDLQRRPRCGRLVAGGDLVVGGDRFVVLLQRPMAGGHLVVIVGEVRALAIVADRFLVLAGNVIGLGDLPAPLVGVRRVVLVQLL